MNRILGILCVVVVVGVVAVVGAGASAGVLAEAVRRHQAEVAALK